MVDYKIVDIYTYNPVTKEYLGKTESDKNPLDPETPIIPANSTTIKPPEVQEGYIIVWVGNKWEYREDHRGEVWYNANTKSVETISFIGDLPDYYYSPDSVIANPPEGNYWEYDKENDKLVGNAALYKVYVNDIFSQYWEIKQNTPYEFNGFRYIASWRDLYTSIWVTLKDGIKDEYRLQDYDNKFNVVTAKTMKPIIEKMTDINDEMFIDKHNLQLYFLKNDNFEQLQAKFDEYTKKVYK